MQAFKVLFKLLSGEKARKILYLLCAVFAIVALALITIYLLASGIPFIAETGFAKFLFGKTWHPTGEIPAFGVLPMLVTTIYVTILSVAIGVTVGLMAAVCLYKFVPKKLSNAMLQMVNLLAGIPSVVYGLFGVRVVVRFLRDSVSPTGVGYGILAASIVLSIMILPTIVSLTLDSLRGVPDSYFDGSLALGANKAQTVFRIMLPAAKSGTLAAVVLAIGRAVGETMAVLMVIGGSTGMPNGLFQSLRTLTANIAMDAQGASDKHMSALIASGVILFILAFLLNLGFSFLKKDKNRKTKKAAAIVAGNAITSVNAPPQINAETLMESESAAASGADGTVATIAKKTTAFIRRFTNSISNVITSIVNSRAAVKIKAFFARVKKVWRKVAAVIAKGWSALANYLKHLINSISGGLKWVGYAALGLSLIALIGVLSYVFIEGIGGVTDGKWHFNITMQLLFGKYENGPSILPAFLGTVYLIVIALVIAAPIGIGCAVFLTEYNKSTSKLVKGIRVSVETLAGIPSIVYGLFGYLIFVVSLKWGYSLLGGGITLAVMVLPGIVRATEESILSVPQSFRDGSFALGAGKARTISKIIVPSAAGGIVTSVILAADRVIAESAVLLLTIGMVVDNVPKSPMSPGTNLALDVYYFLNNGHPEQGAATAVVLVVLVILINLLSTWLGGRIKKKLGGG